ncbi:MAG: acylphosphatase [Deltaproteobacteria bacterium CG12_big_fil_rev_8_21_14_0_65_43_10]|nr:MAG: acylphosphatase [Deltaproteobacteria bacterium CG2_30_43_15]PIQ45548.1 MAG: acylphosphatase [Deltaproteobacteria bacterium CG12_big_fil_rev_8_21_14_0_65_43_10]PIU84934.1 MAG: acylphosphatase [Deltaproteobacteria bacterium CG06_land_8_20_14_3_00_44_19]PIX24360.1 MAG: acylphosphatase [Deltaproteobacteria bacterium CG_4_8_14_3_um_filter_43_13]PIZ20649.1 MAG: acylphosphatase [Deltaproteobacteria bacterium CG_4_10_14_0_8_um_filter_43_12]PJB41911.1 MAG: acylphosphatase [Deltaproteobacteria b
MPKGRAHVLVKGRVQGVYFRAETQHEARRLGVNGWVKNLRDRSVEAVFEGEEDRVKSMIKWCNHGPAGAIVTDISIDWQDYKGEFNGFSITY